MASSTIKAKAAKTSREVSLSARSSSRVKKKRMTQTERVAHSDAKMSEVAIRLICEKGTHSVTLKEVGELAGFSRGLASNRFGSKEALFGTLVSQFNHQWHIELDRRIGGRTGIPAALAALNCVEFYLEERKQFMRAMYVLWYESIASHSEISKRLAEFHERYREDVARWVSEGQSDNLIRPDVDPRGFAVQFCSFIFGTIYQWLVRPEAIDVKRAFSDFRSVTLLLLGKRHA